jgi:hypothetical protein
MQNIERLTNITGSHLTAADKRNIKALLNHDGLVLGEWFKVGTKQYALTATADGYEVATMETAADDMFGRRSTKTYRSSFRAA